MFHSSPGPPATGVRGACMFQSSPGQKAGRNNGPGRHGDHVGGVSILARPEGRVQHRAAGGVGEVALRVSILARPEGRVQPSVGELMAFTFAGVSILTRPGGRVQLWNGGPVPTPTGFNPHPARRPSATTGPKSTASSARSFNPHPASWPGATGPGGRCRGP